MFSSNSSQVSTAANYIEDVFSTYLYTGTGATQTITNNINLSTNGGLVWTKRRNAAGYGNYFIDTVRGATKAIESTSTSAETTYADSLTAFTTSGYTLGADTLNGGFNNGAGTYVGWTFREQPKFFDIVTYTGNGAARTIAHNLDSVPGCIFVKRTDTTSAWAVYHRSLLNTEYLVLNTTAAAVTNVNYWNSTTPTSTVFSLGNATAVNASGGTYVAYLFAHDAGGFGATGTDNVISCGTFTTNSSGKATITLGYEPQIVIYKRSVSTGGDWWMYDTMRGLTVSLGNEYLRANSTGAAGVDSAQNYISPTATGFTMGNTASVGNSTTFIYIAIRRGPMKTPTSGTSVFSPIAYSGANGAAQNISAGFPVDADIIKIRNDGTRAPLNHARLMGGVFLNTESVAAEANFSDNIVSFNVSQNVIGLPTTSGGTNEINGASTSNYIAWAFRRAPSFFDVVCYTGDGSTQNITHNLSVAPEWIIVKKRSGADDWMVLNGMTASQFKYTFLNQIDLNYTNSYSSTNMLASQPTATIFNLGNHPSVNSAGNTFVAYLFATVAGVSKVGSYTGTAALQTIDCGFSAGARFVLIKRSDNTGSWYVWDSARGISSGNDPYLLINSTAAEVTGTNYVDTTSVGFQVTAAAPAALNASGGSYIFLAIA